MCLFKGICLTECSIVLKLGNLFPTKLWQSRLTCSQIPGASEVSNCHAVYTQTLIWPQRRQFIVSSPSHQFFQVSLNPKFGHSRWKVFGKSSCTSRILIQGFSTTICQKENCFVLKWEWKFFWQNFLFSHRSKTAAFGFMLIIALCNRTTYKTF